MKVSQNKGFTLIELLITILILGLVMTVTYPLLSRGSTSIHLRTAGRDVMNTMRYARERAVTEQTRMMISVDRDGRTIKLSNYLGENNRSYVLPRDVRIERLALAGGEPDSREVKIRFLPNGSSDSAEILLKSDTGSYLRIISDPITGGARMETGQGDNR